MRPKMNQVSVTHRAVFAAKLSVFSNTCLVILKLVIGLMIGSVSVISEAIHSAIDLLAAVLALFAVWQASKPADDDHPYGHGKFENVSGTLEAALIFIAAGWIVIEAIHKFNNPQVMGGLEWGIALMFLSSLINIVISKILFKVGRETSSIALEADAWHLQTDVYTSLGVMGGLAVIWVGKKFFPEIDLNWIDPVAAIGVALLIIKAAYELIKKAALDLFDVSLPVSEIEWIKILLGSYPQIQGFHDLKTRKAGKNRFIEVHLVINGSMTVNEANDLSEEITEKITTYFKDSSVLIHTEPLKSPKL